MTERQAPGRPAGSFDLTGADERQIQESAQILTLALTLREKGTPEDVTWAQELTKEMVRYGDEGAAWWIARVKERMGWA